jgi:hypothetical protein
VRTAAAALLLAAASADGFAQAPDPDAQARFERFLVAPDHEAEALARSLAAEAPEALAALARSPATSTDAVRLVVVPGFDPPLAGVVVLPRTKSPPHGFPYVVVSVGPPVGPEEFALRRRFGAYLEAGAALLAPVEITGLAGGRPVDEPFGQRAAQLVPLCVAAERAAPLDATRRVLLLGSPSPRFYGPEPAIVGGAFAGIHAAIAGDDPVPVFKSFVSLAPRRVTIHHGSRLCDPSRLKIRDLVLRGAPQGLELRVIEDRRLEHAPLARLTATAAEEALRDLSPNRAPSSFRATCDPDDPRGASATWFVWTGARANLAFSEFGTRRIGVRVEHLAPGKTATLLVPRLDLPAPDWTAEKAWRVSEGQGSIPETGPTIDVEGAEAVRRSIGDAFERLFAFRLAARSGLAIAAVSEWRLTKSS